MLPAQSGLYQHYCYPPLPLTGLFSYHYSYVSIREKLDGDCFSISCQINVGVSPALLRAMLGDQQLPVGLEVSFSITYCIFGSRGMVDLTGFLRANVPQKSLSWDWVRPLKIFHLTLPVKEQQAKSDLGPWLCVQYMQGPFRRQRLLVLVESDQTTSLHASEPNAWTFIICEPLIV